MIDNLCTACGKKIPGTGKVLIRNMKRHVWGCVEMAKVRAAIK